MGKKQKANTLGRSLVKDKQSSYKGKRRNQDSLLHTTELADGYDWARLNLRSVTEENSLQEFLSTAELAGTDFQAEKLNIKFVNPKCGVGLLTKDEKNKIKKLQSEKKDLLKIPRRPAWSSDMTAEDLHTLERDSFLEWRRNLATAQEESGLVLTPYEKNLDFWRQLWRVVERSDVVVQILDARNPLLFRCRDLEKYVKEVDKNKENLLLLNKAEFLTQNQREAWAKYFYQEGVNIVFFSAKQATTNLDLSKINEEDESNNDENSSNKALFSLSKEDSKRNSDDNDCEVELSDNSDDYETESEEEIDEETAKEFSERGKCSTKLLDRTELISFFKQISQKSDSYVTIGLVGYPNVGKSSSINAILQDKKTSVSATPGKTKHFQTLFVDQELMLCDCPGLVMPSFVYTKAELVVNGILPIDQMRNHVPPINLICSQFHRNVLEDKYSIMIPKPMEGEDQDRCPNSEELLNSYAYARGFMTQNGQPDNPRAARYVLKDYVNGDLLYCHAPPGIAQDDYYKPKLRLKRVAPPPTTRQAQLATKPIKVSANALDSQFFKQISLGYHTKGPVCVPSGNSSFHGSTLSLASAKTEGEHKPWKNHKEKRNKKEKLRRVYKHLDE